MNTSQKVFALGLTGLILSATAPRDVFASESLAPKTTLAEVVGIAEAQPARNLVGKFNDGSHEFGSTDRYSDGMYLSQTVKMNDDYTAEVLYFIRNGTKGEFGEWSVRCDLYKKDVPAAVNTMRADGRIEGGKFLVTNKTEPDKKVPLEFVFTQGAYEQSALFDLTRKDEASLKSYFDYFMYAWKSATKGPLNPMPPGYNPLQAK